MRILIAGGGIGGLATALALHRRGWPARVLERAAGLETAGAGIVMWPNAMRALSALGVGEAVMAAGAEVDTGEVRDVEGRRLMGADQTWLHTEMGLPTIALHRADLIRILHDALPPGTVRFEAGIDGIADGSVAGMKDAGDRVQVTMAGATEGADLLIGADGVQSRVRRFVQPPVTPRYAGYVAWRGVASGLPGAIRTGTSETWGPGQRFGMVSIGGGRVYWYATANQPAGRKVAPADRHHVVRSRFGSWHPPILNVIESTPEGTILEHDVADLAPFRGWSRGRAVLIGDAAHATTPNLGQGAGMALEDAVVLARHLTRTVPAKALADFENERWARTAWIVSASRRAGQVGQIANPLGVMLRDRLLPSVPERVSRSAIRRATAWSDS